MMLRLYAYVFLVGIALAALTACESGPLPPALATETPLPTPTPLPTATPTPEPTPVPLGSGPLGASGATLVDALGREVRLTGVNWSGMETSAFAPNGLASRPADEMLDQIVSAGFNTIRLPYSNQLFDAASRPNGIDFQKNRELVGLSGTQVMDWIVEGARRRGLKIILDRHRPSPYAQSDLWYTDAVSEERWIRDWVKLAQHYRGNSAVIGADLHNEPHGAATWGDGNPRTDWRLAAERAGNAILEVNPDWLIIVEGVERTEHGAYWWGGNLSSAGLAPVRLIRPERLIYSAHDYGPSVSWQQWFAPPAFPANLESIWRSNWAYLQDEAIAPVLIGEFGGRSIGPDTEGVWQRALIGFIQDRGFSYAYWVWNFDGWTGGLLQDDQRTLNQAKLGLLSPTQWPLLGEPDGAVLRRPAVPAPLGLRPEGPPGLAVNQRSDAPEGECESCPKNGQSVLTSSMSCPTDSKRLAERNAC